MADHGATPLDSVHPELLDLMMQKNVFPSRDDEELSEDVLAEAIGVSISLLTDEDQLDMLSRFMTDREIALQTLQHPDVQNMDNRIALTSDERALVRKGDDPPPPEGEDPPKPAGVGECLICGEGGHLTLGTCGCPYCLSCLREFVQNGTLEEEAFPPRCCLEAVDEATIRRTRQPGLVHLLRMMDVEFSSPPLERTYCYDGRCATFIPVPVEEGCPACGRYTCVECGRRAHPGEGCGAGDGGEEERTEDVWAMMDRNNVINCPGCGRMVNILDGCNEMTCFCGELFCYICGGPRGPGIQRSCECPTWGQHDTRIRMAQREGLKPPQWRRYREAVAGRPADLDAPRKIPQVRPWPGEWPLAWGVPRRRMRGEGRLIPLGGANGGGGQPGQQPRDRPVREVVVNGAGPVREILVNGAEPGREAVVNGDGNRAAQQLELEELRAWRLRRIEADQRDRQAQEAAAQAQRELDARQFEAEAAPTVERWAQEAAEWQRERDAYQLLHRRRQAEALAAEEQQERDAQAAFEAADQRRREILLREEQEDADERAAEQAELQLEVPQVILDHQRQAEQQRGRGLDRGRHIADARLVQEEEPLLGAVPGDAGDLVGRVHGRRVRFELGAASSSSSSLDDRGVVEQDRGTRRERDRDRRGDGRRRGHHGEDRQRRHAHEEEFPWNRRRETLAALPGVVQCMLEMVGVAYVIELRAWGERRENRRRERRRRSRERRRESE